MSFKEYLEKNEYKINTIDIFTQYTEKEIYSTDSPATEKKARLKLCSDGSIEINGNADYAVSWTDLNTVLQNLVTAINNTFATKKDEPGSPGALTLDLSGARVDTVKLP